MVLDVETPDPPDLSNRGVPNEFETVELVGGAGDLRREELEEILQDGAWNEAFEEWAEYTDLTEDEFHLLRDLGLFQEMDIFWDPTDERLRSEAPPLPDDWQEQVDVARSETTRLVSKLEGELSDLGDVVVEMLEDAYIDYGEAEASDYVWGEETFGQGTRD